jgi:peroxiredoxin
LRDFVREGNVQIPVAIDHARAIDDAFGVGPFDPTTIIIDSNGQVRYVMEGFPLDLEEQIERALKSLTQPQDANR